MRESAAPASGARHAFVQLVLAIALFGFSWPVMKTALEDGAAPLWLAAGRAGLSALTSFALLIALRRVRLPRARDLPIILTIGVFQLTAFFALINLGLRYVPAGRSAVLAYTTSLWLVPLAAASGERIGLRRLSGVLLGLLGSSFSSIRSISRSSGASCSAMSFCCSRRCAGRSPSSIPAATPGG